MHLAHSAARVSGVHEFAIALAMWLGMVFAMMLPVATPAIRAFAGIAASGRGTDGRRGTLACFVGGYLVAWSGFGVLATLAQSVLAALAQRAAVPHAPHALVLAGSLLVVAGAYQFSSLKAQCLRQCRSPLAFFLAHWRAGARGAFELGQRHGLHCLGCCWALMALMLIGGAMSLRWTALLTALLLVEKLAPAGAAIGRAVGVGLMGWGVALLASAVGG